MRKFTPRGKKIQQDEKDLLAEEGLKYCRKCGYAKSFKEFHKDPCKKDGFQVKCKCCFRAYQRSERGRACIKRSNQSEKGRARQKRHSQTEKGKATRRKYRQSEKGRAADKRYEQSDKGKTKNRHNCALRRARELCLAPPNADLKEIEKLYNDSNKEVHVDHIISMSENFGLHCIENLKLMNGSENISKKTTLPDKEIVAKLDKIFLEKYGYDRLKHGPFMEDLAKCYKDTKHTSEVK